MSGVTGIPATSFVASADVTPLATPAQVQASAPPETARPVEPVTASDAERGHLSSAFLLHALAFSAVAKMVDAALAGGPAQGGQEPATEKSSPPAADNELAVLALSARFVAALDASRGGRPGAGSGATLFDALPPLPDARPSLPSGVAEFAHVLRRQILQDYRVAFMVHGRLSTAVAQLLL